ncbi:hypothetical protein PSAL_006180 [Pseudooceanicola algae]|uniref:Uncharacterized protein n=1 Tax=Pseudooceanicola algae TaxID=1537215 RepID=A0A418SDS8_9RHOB|nr:hypothetical protein PSAL_006180 [Pseudooceanicola algae]
MPAMLWIQCACGHQATRAIPSFEGMTRDRVLPAAKCGRCGQRGAVDMRIFWDTADPEAATDGGSTKRSPVQ